MALLLSLLGAASIGSVLAQGAGPANNTADCSCGYYDSINQNFFTDSIIYYFNESTAFPSVDFIAEDYMNKYERGWNSQFRQGANPSNALLGNATSALPGSLSSLQLFLTPSTPDHTVVGGAIRTLRQDIQYGSFRALMKSPKPYYGGSALTMQLFYNDTQSIRMSLANTDEPDEAWMSTLMNHEFPNRYLGVNYTQLSNASFKVADPWDYNELRIDWTPNGINYSINGIISRSVVGSADDGSDRPNTPSPFTLKHWSVGDEYFMEGPPMHKVSEANVGWVRMFFNASTTSADALDNFAARCSVDTACSTENMQLRGSTPFSAEATQMFFPAPPSYKLRWAAVGIGSFGLAVSIVVVLNILLRRLILPSAKPAHGNAQDQTTRSSSDDESSQRRDSDSPWRRASSEPSPYASGYATPVMRGYPREHSNAASTTGTLVSPTPVNLTRPSSIRGVGESNARAADGSFDHWTPSTRISSDAITREPPLRSLNSTPAPSTRATSFLGRAIEGPLSYGPGLMSRDDLASRMGSLYAGSIASGRESVPPVPSLPGHAAPAETRSVSGAAGSVTDQPKPAVTVTEPPAGAAAKPAAPPRQRVDYLAGLVAVCSTLVSMTHFMLTFLPATIEPGAFAHYQSEIWARKSIGPFVFNEVWVVMFFTTSTRFLTTKYLRSGNLADVAEKVVGRVFRLMIPIIGVIILEYFLMDTGTIIWLEYLPSISWSTWPYTVVYVNFGSFLSETLELIYLIPNAMPQITFNYCTGVLWTIPVQIEGSWQCLLGVIVIREIKTPWKRFSYYAVCILFHWYARSWGSFFWGGLMLADLDITYKYKKWLLARPWIYFPLLNLAILLTLAALGNDLISQWTGINFQVIEHDWHPDRLTGMFIGQAATGGFPPYYTPKLNGLVFALCSQLIVEWSTWLQKVIATKVFLWLFPHIFTIYLFHGFVFWSVGAWICVGLGRLDVPYWANMLVTFIGSYAFLFGSLPIITPVVEALGKSATASIWKSASEKPPPKRPTLYPFPSDLFTSRQETSSVEGADSSSSDSVKDVEKGAKKNSNEMHQVAEEP